MHYQKAFKEASIKAKEDFKLIGNCILVEKIPAKEMKTKSGILLPQKDGASSKNARSMTSDYSEFIRVLMTGEGYYNPDTGDSTALEVKPGDIVLVSQQAVHWFTIFGELSESEHIQRIGITQEDQIMAKASGQDGYDKFFSVLNSHL